MNPNSRSRLAKQLSRARSAIETRWFDTQFELDRLERYAVEGVEQLDAEWMKSAFIAPLFELFHALLETEDSVMREIYLDERLRYAPHRAGPEIRAAFFAEILPLEEAALRSALEVDPNERADFDAWLEDLHAPLLREPDAGVVRLLAVGDCLMNEIRIFLPSRCREAGIDLDMRALYFSGLLGKDLPTDQLIAFLRENPVDLIALSFLSYEGLPLYRALLREAGELSETELEDRVAGLTGLMRRYLEELREHSDAPVLLHNASGLPLDRMRRLVPLLPAIGGPQRRVLAAIDSSIRELAEHTANCLLFDEKGIAEERGLRACDQNLLPRNIARGALFHTSRFGSELATPYASFIRSYRDTRAVKVLLIDFDNTLWKGVMADGEVEHDREGQRLLRKLKEAGMLLVAVSKNSPENIRWDEMELAPEDFVLLKISWALKAQTIQEAASELDLGLDSFLLIDDNSAERALVQRELPQVRALDPLEPETWTTLERLLEFPSTRNTDEARARTQIYRDQAKRREAMAVTLDYPEMMASLQLRVRFGEVRPGDVSRVCELFERTNQFNTTTIRYGRADVERMLADPDFEIFVGELEDKFGNHGLVSVTVLQRADERLVFDSFVMSCRAMGFGVEQLVLRSSIDRCLDGVREIVGRFIPTARNDPASQLYSSAGFEAQGKEEWVLKVDSTLPEIPPWFDQVDRGA